MQINEVKEKLFISDKFAQISQSVNSCALNKIKMTFKWQKVSIQKLYFLITYSMKSNKILFFIVHFGTLTSYGKNNFTFKTN